MNKQTNLLSVQAGLLVLGAALALMPIAHAADVDEDRGGSILHTAVKLGGTYTDNLYYSPNPDRNTFGLELSPEVTYAYSFARFLFTAGGAAEAAGFNQAGGKDNYLDGKSRAGLKWQPAERHHFDFNSDLQFSHDPHGLNRTEGSPTQNTTLDRWRKFGTDVKYYYGLPEDSWNTETALKIGHKQYTSNESVTAFQDYGSVLGDITLLYNYSPKSALLFDISGTRTNFDQAASNRLDSTEMHYLVGGRWAATAKTSADVRVGYVTRKPRDPTIGKFSAIDWQMNLRWAATASRTFLLQTARISQESYATNVFSFVDNRQATLGWEENWMPRFSTKADIGYIQSRFIGALRTDNSLITNIGAEYRATEYATLLANLAYGTRQSDATGLDYNRFSSYLGIKLSR